jgi:hypothetical protein
MVLPWSGSPNSRMPLRARAGFPRISRAAPSDLAFVSAFRRCWRSRSAVWQPVRQNCKVVQLYVRDQGPTHTLLAAVGALAMPPRG